MEYCSSDSNTTACRLEVGSEVLEKCCLLLNIELNEPPKNYGKPIKCSPSKEIAQQHTYHEPLDVEDIDKKG